MSCFIREDLIGFLELITDLKLPVAMVKFIILDLFNERQILKLTHSFPQVLYFRYPSCPDS